MTKKQLKQQKELDIQKKAARNEKRRAARAEKRAAKQTDAEAIAEKVATKTDKKAARNEKRKAKRAEKRATQATPSNEKNTYDKAKETLQTVEQKPPKRSKSVTVQWIAYETLDIPTLETQNSDSLDFHEVSVWDVKQALEAAFDAGRQAQTRKIRKRFPEIKTYMSADGKRMTVPEEKSSNKFSKKYVKKPGELKQSISFKEKDGTRITISD